MAFGLVNFWRTGIPDGEDIYTLAVYCWLAG